MNAAQYVARVRDRQALDRDTPIYQEVELLRSAQVQPTEPNDPEVATDINDIDTLGLVEMLLKNRRALYQVLRNPTTHAALLPRLLAIALTGFVLFGVTMSLVLTVSNRWPSLTAISTWVSTPHTALFSLDTIHSKAGKFAPWINGQAFVMTTAYAFGLIAASGVALPSLYFYCLLAGVRMTMLEVVVHAVKSKAIAAVALIGILPIYVALAMGAVIFNVGEYGLRFTMLLGLILPFIAGFWGTASLYQGFAQLCDRMPPGYASNRKCFLRRLVLSWSACYSAIVPVMIYSLWEVFSRV